MNLLGFLSVVSDRLGEKHEIVILATRVHEKIAFSSECWLWTASVNGGGYGCLTTGRQLGESLAHRLVYTLLRGVVPDGMTLDHLCRNPVCVNPDHMEPVTMRENLQRAARSRDVANRTCVNGHPWVPENRISNGRHGWSRCRPCHADRELSRKRLERTQ